MWTIDLWWLDQMRTDRTNTPDSEYFQRSDYYMSPPLQCVNLIFFLLQCPPSSQYGPGPTVLGSLAKKEPGSSVL